MSLAYLSHLVSIKTPSPWMPYSICSICWGCGKVPGCLCLYLLISELSGEDKYFTYWKSKITSQNSFVLSTLGKPEGGHPCGDSECSVEAIEKKIKREAILHSEMPTEDRWIYLKDSYLTWMHQHPIVKIIFVHKPFTIMTTEKLHGHKTKNAKSCYFFVAVDLLFLGEKWFSNILILLSHNFVNNQKRNFKNKKKRTVYSFGRKIIVCYRKFPISKERR